ncbi:MAG TPA: energy transducer TonB [Pyrinomonadaceae bacterium]|jgi:TonB family protein|nr:energy transducer TonB [Pyrinomonadaceae bacterium]
MSKRTNLTLLLVLLSPLTAGAAGLTARAHRAYFASPTLSAASDREQDGLAGPVRRVKTETAKITVKNGQPAEAPRVVLETTTYDQKGNRVDNAYFLAAGGTLTGKEVYKYDDRGNMVEMTLHNADGTLLSKETYSYEFDAVGNWVKMTTSVAVIEGGKVTFEPSEVTYRTISYYLDEATMAKLSQPAAAPKPAASPSPSPAAQQPAAAQFKPAGGATPPNGQTAAKAAQKVAALPVVVAPSDRTTAAPALSANAHVAPTDGGPVVRSDAEAPAARPAQRGPLKPISGGILNGKAVSLPAPLYPDIAKRAGARGTVEVEVVIDTNGKVISAKAVKGPPMLQGAAEQAARMARFTPTLLSGQPVRISGLITYNFSIQP